MSEKEIANTIWASRDNLHADEQTHARNVSDQSDDDDDDFEELPDVLVSCGPLVYLLQKHVAVHTLNMLGLFVATLTHATVIFSCSPFSQYRCCTNVTCCCFPVATTSETAASRFRRLTRFGSKPPETVSSTCTVLRRVV